MTFIHILPRAFFLWCEHVWPATWLKETTWVFAIVETIHIMVLAVLLGTIFLLDMRLLGFAMKRRSVSKLARDFAPWTVVSVILMVITGLMLFMSEAVKLSASAPFFFKMVFLLMAVTTQLAVHHRVSADAFESSAGVKVIACFSLLFWFGVAVAGRAIAFL